MPTISKGLKKTNKTIKSKLPRAETPDRWRVEEDLRTIRRAGEITGNKGRMAHVKRLAAEEASSLNKIVKKK